MNCEDLVHFVHLDEIAKKFFGRTVGDVCKTMNEDGARQPEVVAAYVRLLVNARRLDLLRPR